jgi:CHAD domain-containing protein
MAVTRSSPSAGARAKRLLRQRVRGLFQQLTPALQGDEEAVHQLRVACRRLRVTLPLLAGKPEGRRVRRARRTLRGLVRGAAGGRDLDVILAVFEEHVAAEPEPTRELLALRGRLRAARTRSRHQLARALLALEPGRLRQDLARVQALGVEHPVVVLSRVRAYRDERGGALVQLLEELGERFDPDVLHEARTRGRRLRYAAEVAAGVLGTTSEAAERFEQLQEQLGQLHDAWVLAGWLGRAAEGAEGRGQEALAAEARRQQSYFVERSRAIHDTFLARRPVDFVRAALERMASVPPTTITLSA